ncbi:MAG: endopeptidase La [Halobacteriovoraceae bacterium]|nr:endopeptidase La [Halobacteriovoraceae bacterium]
MSKKNNNDDSIDFKEVVPLLPIRDIVVYPFMILPLFVGRDSSMQAVEYSLEQSNRLILLASQKDITAESPEPNDIYEVGTIAMIMRMRKLPDGRIKILVQGLSKARITNFEQMQPFFKVRATKMEDIIANGQDITIKALMRNVREQLERVIASGKVLSPDIMMVLEDINDPGRLADLIASNLNLHVAEAQIILELLNPIERLHKIDDILVRELEILAIQAKIRNVAKDEISKSQKEYFLREQIKAIKNELGEEDLNGHMDEFSEFREKIKKAKMPAEAEKESIKQLSRLEKMHPDSSESSILRNYLEWLVELPWSSASKDNIDLDYAKKILNNDHFDLDKIKERILEFLAVYKLKKGKIKGPILCFTGPPGVGKTSLGKSIARAIGRKFTRISLGGVKDEAEIRGHRRTYVGAMPGRLIQALKQEGTNNPIILLDEVDKIGSDYKGDPSNALLEVLDPEQNNSFRDHYINIPFDLSNVMFIATANILDNIPIPLRDRMEVIVLSGYTFEEKMAICKKFLIPKQMDENGIGSQHIDISESAISYIIKSFTAEAGLRNLERHIGALCRKVAVKVAKGDAKKNKVNPEMIDKMIGPPPYNPDDAKKSNEVGVVTGLAWTEVGGQILHIEAISMKGSKGLTLTGQLGDVMKESAQTALGYIRGQAQKFGIPEKVFEEKEIHIHLPAGATPKEGPSAGITLATAIVSLLTNNPVDHKVAMTGEITLTGKVLPVGGIKEKVLAAMRVNIKTVIIPEKSKAALSEIPPEYRKKINFICVEDFEQVLEVALIGWKNKSGGNKKGPSKKNKEKPVPAAA